MTPIGTEEVGAIEREIAALEARAGVQVVAAVVPRSDSYPEVPWRAFALGASVAALVALVVDVGRPDWLSVRSLLLQALAILGSGAIAAVIAQAVPVFARFFLGTERTASEVRQAAEGMFIARELFLAPQRDAVLVLVSLFEHRVVIVPDVFYRGRVEAAEWQTVVERMTPLLKRGLHGEAFLEGLGSLDALLARKGIAAGRRPNAIPDALVRGAFP